MSGRFDNALRYRPADHPEQSHFTPPYLLDRIAADLGGAIGLDPCTSADNPTGAAAFFTADDDGLSRPWVASSVYVNPPYGKAREPRVDRCVDVGRTARLILVMPAATDTKTFQKAARTAAACVFVKGRVKFGVRRPNGRQRAASHPTCLLGWLTELDACAELGVRMRLG